MSLGPRRRRRSGATWYIETSQDGSCNVLKRGREVRSGVTLSTARNYLVSHATADDTIYLVDPDGVQRRMRTAKG